MQNFQTPAVPFGITDLEPGFICKDPLCCRLSDLSICRISEGFLTWHTSAAFVGDWQVTAHEDMERDWHYYSKDWHRQHGPKKIVHARTVTFTSLKSGQTRKVELDSWRGNWQLNSLIKAKIVKPRKGQMAIRLHPACDIKLLGDRRGYKFYERSVKGDVIDYCLVSPLGLTYHGESYLDCLRGLKAKRRKQQRREVATISFKLVKSLGFCSAGIRSFCNICGLDPTETYTPQEIEAAVREHLSSLEHFAPELKKLAEAIGYPVPEFN